MATALDSQHVLATKSTLGTYSCLLRKLVTVTDLGKFLANSWHVSSSENVVNSTFLANKSNHLHTSLVQIQCEL